MQDRFKFRAWNTQSKTMKEVSQLSFDEKQVAEYAPKDKVSVHLNFQPHFILMQCTGLKDKNGKLIYEGDIVNLKNTRFDFEETRVVMFKDCAFQFSLPNSTQIDRPLYCWAINYLNHYKHIELEIIGNIYETPELLEDK